LEEDREIEVAAFRLKADGTRYASGEKGTLKIMVKAAPRQVNQTSIDEKAKELNDEMTALGTSEKEVIAKKAAIAKLDAELRALNSAKAALEAALSSYRATVKSAKEQTKLHETFLNEKKSKVTLDVTTQGKIDEARNEAKKGISAKMTDLDALTQQQALTPPAPDSLQGRQIAFDNARMQVEKSVAQHNHLKGLEAQLKEALDNLKKLKSEIESAEGKGDQKSFYFLLEELKDALETIKTKAEDDGSLLATNAYALADGDYTAQFDKSWYAWWDAVEKQAEEDEKLKTAKQKQRDDSAELENLKKSRRQTLQKQVDALP
jgi:hypothetical protein